MRGSTQAANDVKWLIEQSGLTGTLRRQTAAGADTFFGEHQDTESLVGSINLEMRDLSPKDLTEIGADAVASVLPEAGVQEQDFIVVGADRYKVTAIKLHNFFGTITHMDLHLTLERRDG